MPSVRVNVAVLSIAGPSPQGNVASENLVADRLTGAGHQVASFEAVRDSETAIRSQLVGWIADPDIDVVIVVGDGEHTSAAIKPMIDQSLPGFADLLRMLAFQEIGASAMLSTAEAARCGTTFVFVVPGSEAAVKAAMEKLILPQLDPATKPRNLIGSMPRLRDAVEHDMTKVDVAKLGEVGPAEVTRVDNAKMESARRESARVSEAASNSVPTPIAPEKTATGAGVTPKLPAGSAPVVAASGPRQRQRTGVNVIVRKVEDPTKPIELDKLERQLALSKEEEATKAAHQAVADAAASANTRVTKPMATTPASRANVATRPLDVGNLRAPASGAATPGAKPLPSIKAKATEPPKLAEPKPDEASFADVGDSTKPLDLTKPTTPVGAGPIARERPSSSQLAAKRPKLGAGDVGDTTKPLDLGRLPKLPPGASTERVDAAGDSDDTGQIISLPPKQPANGAAASTPAPVPARAPAPTPVVRSERGPAAKSTPPPQATPRAAAPAASPAVARVRQPTPPPPPVVAPLPVVARPTPIADERDSVETLDLEPDPDVAPAPIEEEDPVAPPALLAPPAPSKRRPTEPPPNISELINAAPSSSLAELPQGAFVYPTQRSSKVPLVLGLLVLSAALGGGAMWLFNRKSDDKPKEREEVAQPTVEIDAAAPVVAVVDIDAAEPAPVEVEPPDAAVEEPAPPTTATAKPARPTARPPTRVTTKPATKPTTKPPADDPPPEKPERPAGPIAEPGCEEVACVMEKYARPCCARFKPQGDTFQPSNADTLSKPQIKAGVDRMKPRVIACAEQHKEAKGTVRLSMTVDGEGNVTELSVQAAPDDALGECVASALRKAKFAKTTNGGSFTYPFVF